MPKGIYDRKTSTVCSNCEVNPRYLKSSWCRACKTILNRVEWSAWSHERKREKWLKHKYNLTYAEYEQLHKSQNGKCAICSIDISLIQRDNGHTVACVDHCHKTGTIRGLLCNHCNRAIGLLKDDLNIVYKLEKYLDRPLSNS